MTDTIESPNVELTTTQSILESLIPEPETKAPTQGVRVFKEKMYEVRIKVTSPCGMLTLDSSKLRDQKVHEAIKRSNGKSKDSFPIFEVIDSATEKVVISAGKAVTRLNTVMDGLQKAFMWCSGDRGAWYVPQAKIDALDEAIKTELDAERDALRIELLENYDDALELFELRLKDILDSAELMDEYEFYRAKFPPRAELEAKLNYEVLTWNPVPSLEEIQAAAIKDAALKRQEEVVKQTIAMLQSDAPKVLDESYGEIAGILTSLETCNPKKVTEYHVKRITTNKERLETLLGMWRSMFGSENESLEMLNRRLEPLCQMKTVIVSGVEALQLETTPDALENALSQIRLVIREDVAIVGSGEGARFLNEWSHPERNLEAQMEEIKSKLAELDESDEAKEEASKLQRRLRRLEKTLQIKIGKLMELTSEAREAVEAIAGDSSSEDNNHESELSEEDLESLRQAQESKEEAIASDPWQESSAVEAAGF